MSLELTVAKRAENDIDKETENKIKELERTNKNLIQEKENLAKVFYFFIFEILQFLFSNYEYFYFIFIFFFVQIGNCR